MGHTMLSDGARGHSEVGVEVEIDFRPWDGNGGI